MNPVMLALMVHSSLAAAGHAAPTEYAESFDFADLDIEAVLGEVTAASGKSESLLLAPATVTVLDAQDIESTAARSIPDLLRAVPGVQVTYVAPGNYAVSMRGTAGLQSNNLIIVLDGVPMNNPFDGNVDWAAFPATIDEVERIEVVRGPVSPIYGADAFTGVVVITTRKPTGDAHLSIDGRIGGGASQSLARSTSGVISMSRGGSVAWRLSMHGLRDATSRRYQTSSPLGVELHQQPAAERAGMLGRVHIDAGNDTAVSLVAGAGWSHASALDSLVLTPTAQESRTAHVGAELRVTELWGGPHKLTLQSAARYLERSRASRRVIDAFTYDGTHSYRARASASLALALPHNANVQLGLESSVIGVRAPYIHPAENDIARFGHAARVAADIRLADSWVLEAAARGDWSAFTRRPEASGRASVIFYDDSYALRASVGSAYRNPSYVDLAGRFIDPATGLILLEGTPTLRAPRSTAAELAGIFGWFDGTLTLRPTLFFQQLVNLVVGDFAPLVRESFRNDRRAIEILGAELESDWSLSRRLSLHASAMFLHFLSEQDDPSATVGDDNYNAKLSARMEARLMLSEALYVATAASLISGREYNVRAGIPPRLLPKYAVPTIYRAEAALRWSPLTAVPLELQLKALAVYPLGVTEAAYPRTGQLEPRLFVGAVWEPR